MIPIVAALLCRILPLARDCLPNVPLNLVNSWNSQFWAPVSKWTVCFFMRKTSFWLFRYFSVKLIWLRRAVGWDKSASRRQCCAERIHVWRTCAFRGTGLAQQCCILCSTNNSSVMLMNPGGLCRGASVFFSRLML